MASAAAVPLPTAVAFPPRAAPTTGAVAPGAIPSRRGQGLTRRVPHSDPMEGDPVELGVELLSKLEGEVSLPEAIDRIEAITTDPALTRRILDTAERRGAIEREDGIITPERGSFVRFGSEVVTKEGEFACRRCGAGLSTGYFIEFDAGELGPFGSSCIRRVTGRD